VSVNRSEAIKLFLNTHTHPDLASLYHKGMEVQVNVAKDNGERVEAGDFKGKAWVEWTDGVEKWASYRMPKNAMSEPTDNDYKQHFNLDTRTEGVGMTGWNWQEKKSIWVAYDFDAMLGHSDRHSKKLSDKELQEIQDVVTGLPFITLRKSTSGRGLHLYIFLEPVDTANHTEHAALARAILSMVAGLSGFNFTDKVDICGGNMWVWHRKMRGTDGLKLIREGHRLERAKIPANWRDHLNVITHRSTKIISVQTQGEQDIFDELTGQRAKIKPDADHLMLVNWLNDRKLMGWWDADNHMLVTHTAYLADAHKELKAAGKMRGEFYTESKGKEFGTDINCFMFPCRNGVWAIRRYGVGCKEHKFWKQDGRGYTQCYFNRDLVLEEVARLYDAIELEGKAYQFKTGVEGCEAFLKLGVVCNLPKAIELRIFKIKELAGDGKYAAYVPKTEGDNTAEMEGWAVEKSVYKRIFNNPRRGVEDENSVLGDYDAALRHIVSEQAEDLGWVINDGSGQWRSEPIQHLRLLLKSKGVGGKDVDLILGAAVSRAWTVVNRPFQPEYPGDRQWNRSKARFKIPPTIEGENLSYPTWDRVLRHCGGALDDTIRSNPWCRDNGVHCGSDYLKLWYACLIRHPQMPLPYLGFYGDQNSGKSTFHEMFCDIILAGGYTRADSALTSGSGFNGELEDSILCIIEETDCGGTKNKHAYNRLKDWVTSGQISIHRKGVTPYMAPNYTHWVQCANSGAYIPVFAGDTRVTLIHVPPLSVDALIPKRDLRQLLVKEAPDFLGSLIGMDIPDSRDRLMLPVIRTIEKEAAEFDNMNIVEQFFKEKIHRINGQYISATDLFKAFTNWCDPADAITWTRNKFGREVPKWVVKGRISQTKTQDTFYANISLREDAIPSRKWVSKGTFLNQADPDADA
jgi:hypothetical protein